jgi:hypothetical protein
MRISTFTALMGSFLLIFSITASAKQSSSSSKSSAQAAISRLKSDCKADIEKQCSDVSPGEGRIAACLNSKEDKLSPQCRNSWISAKAKVSEKLDKTELAFRKDCGPDVQKFCSNVPSGRGRLMDCLGQHEQDLSGSCKNFQAKVQQRVSELIG